MRLHVEVNGETVWSGNGESVTDIPAEWLGRPADGEPARTLFEGKEIAAVQMSHADELEHVRKFGTEREVALVESTHERIAAGERAL